MHELQQLVALQKGGTAKGICSVCSSSPFVLDAALLQAAETNSMLLVEATANQVNQFGGYTGMRPMDFKAALLERAAKKGVPAQRLILGGDHLGPVVWQKEPAAQAMEKAQQLVYDFAAAGYTKIHLDASMPLADDGILSVETIAKRTVCLCKAAEAGYMAYQKQVPTAEQPVYVIGSEVPTPGGSGEEDALSVTKPEALVEMLTVFQDAFSQGGISEAYERVVAAVVQPGVEFGNDTVHEYVPQEAASLIRQAKSLPDIVLEGHSTDYQPEECLKQMVEDGVAILKVGPALTYAAREALFALSYIEKELEVPHPARFMETLEEVMLDAPASWSGHYPATEPAARQLRRFSYSDRSRYYMANQRVEAAIQQLLRNLREQPIPLIMLSQFLPNQYTHIRQGSLINDPEAIVLDRVRDTLRIYWRACGI